MPRSVNYDLVAPTYDRRYVENRYEGLERTLDEFAAAARSVLEVGCGTGHWVARLRSNGTAAVGLDRSPGMLRRAAARVGAGVVVLGRAEALPFRPGSFDRVVVIHAMHHFDDPARFTREAAWVLRRGGRVLIVGLDPSQGAGEWYVYEYFRRTLELDRARYPSTKQIRTWLEAAGFRDCSDTIIHRIERNDRARDVLDRGALTKASTSGLMLLDDDEYREGIEQIRAAMQDAEAAGGSLRLRTNLRLYATFGTSPSR